MLSDFIFRVRSYIIIIITYNVERDSAFLTSPDFYYRSGRVVKCCGVVRLSAECVPMPACSGGS